MTIAKTGPAGTAAVCGRLERHAGETSSLPAEVSRG